MLVRRCTGIPLLHFTGGWCRPEERSRVFAVPAITAHASSLGLEFLQVHGNKAIRQFR